MSTQTPNRDTPAPRLLRVDASARRDDSTSRALGDRLVTTLQELHGTLAVTRRDLAATPPAFVDDMWVRATFTDPAERSDAYRAALAESDELVQELFDADLLVITTPLYNFSIPATLKAWIDMVARARLTFRYTDSGVEGLLKNKRAWLVTASGGVASGSDMDFATGYLRHVLAFLGITDVEVIAADRLNLRGDDAVLQARAQIEALLPAPGRQRAASSAA